MFNISKASTRDSEKIMTRDCKEVYCKMETKNVDGFPPGGKEG